jgi:hypothetical protein
MRILAAPADELFVTSTTRESRARTDGRKFAPIESPGTTGPGAAMAHRDTSVAELCRGARFRPVTLYRYVGALWQFA